MDTLLHAGLSNALMAAALALPAAAVAPFGRPPAPGPAPARPVLFELPTPPLIPIPVLWPDGEAEGRAAAEARPVPRAGAAPLAGDLLGVALADAAEAAHEPAPAEAAEGPAPDRAVPNSGLRWR